MAKHDIIAIREITNRTSTPKASIRLHLRGARGGTHRVLASTTPMRADDPRVDELHDAFRDLAQRLSERADFLCTCPPPKDQPK